LLSGVGVKSTLEMLHPPNRAVASETIVRARLGDIFEPGTSSNRDIWRLWGSASFALVLLVAFGQPLPGLANGKGLSGWILFGQTSVPDGGATVMLLGAALGGLGLVRRYVII
jgi:protein with PEP-CTERM/exosortase system signal